MLILILSFKILNFQDFEIFTKLINIVLALLQLSNEVKEALGLTDRKCNAMAGELEESKALLEAAVRGQRQVEQELSDTREQGSDMQGMQQIVQD